MTLGCNDTENRSWPSPTIGDCPTLGGSHPLPFQLCLTLLFFLLQHESLEVGDLLRRELRDFLSTHKLSIRTPEAFLGVSVQGFIVVLLVPLLCFLHFQIPVPPELPPQDGLVLNGIPPVRFEAEVCERGWTGMAYPRR